MFREIRNKSRAMSEEDALALLAAQDFGILSVSGDDGYPYGVPVNYALVDGKIVFHCARTGHKIDALKRSPKVCFTVVGNHEVMPELLSTCYTSAVVFGTAQFVTDPETKKALAVQMTKQLSGDAFEETAKLKCVEMVDRYEIVEIVPVHVSGKRRVR